jgi:hypothetical protein
MDITQINLWSRISKIPGAPHPLNLNKQLTDDKFITVNDINIMLNMLEIYSSTLNSGVLDKKNIHGKLINLIKNRIDNNFVKLNLVPDIDGIVGGYSSDVWPVFSEIYKLIKNTGKNTLIFKPIDKSSIRFNVIEKNSGAAYLNGTLPLYNKGTYTGIYIIKKNNEPTEYIMRIVSHDPEHYLETDKSKLEFLNFKEYMIKVYYYGSINFKYKDVQKNNKDVEDNDYTVLPNQKDYHFDYIITKKYNSDYYKGLSNAEKFNLLIKIVKMLEKFRKYNRILTDLKWTNIALDENNNPILIDYDDKSILEIIPDNFNMRNDLVISSKFPFTFVPNYLKIDISRNFSSPIDIKKLDKFSFGGLHNIMQALDFNFTTTSINIPIDKQYKNQPQIKNNTNTNISFADLFIYFRIGSAYYEDLASYQEMITVLEYIQQQNVI